MRKLIPFLLLLASLSPAAAQNYSATAGSGLTFGAKSAASVLYPYFIGCDATTVTQCWAVDALGRLTVNLASGSTVAATQSGTWSNVGVTGTFWPYTLGQQVAGSSVPIVLTAAQLTTLTPPTTVAVTQATAANLNATVVGTGTFATQLTGATNNINNIAGTISLPTGAATSANQSTEITSLATIATNTGAAIPAQSTHTVNIGAVDSISPYPATAVPVTASATGTTTATTATLTNVTSHTTYICGFSIRANATAAATNNATVTGTITGTLNFTQWTAPLASGLGVTEEVFNPCVPASAVSTSITVVSGAPGSGGVVSVSAWGYSL